MNDNIKEKLIHRRDNDKKTGNAILEQITDDTIKLYEHLWERLSDNVPSATADAMSSAVTISENLYVFSSLCGDNYSVKGKNLSFAVVAHCLSKIGESTDGLCTLPMDSGTRIISMSASEKLLTEDKGIGLNYTLYPGLLRRSLFVWIKLEDYKKLQGSLVAEREHSL